MLNSFCRDRPKTTRYSSPSTCGIVVSAICRPEATPLSSAPFCLARSESAGKPGEPCRPFTQRRRRHGKPVENAPHSRCQDNRPQQQTRLDAVEQRPHGPLADKRPSSASVCRNVSACAPHGQSGSSPSRLSPRSRASSSAVKPNTGDSSTVKKRNILPRIVNDLQKRGQEYDLRRVEQAVAAADGGDSLPPLQRLQIDLRLSGHRPQQGSRCHPGAPGAGRRFHDIPPRGHPSRCGRPKKAASISSRAGAGVISQPARVDASAARRPGCQGRERGTVGAQRLIEAIIQAADAPASSSRKARRLPPTELPDAGRVSSRILQLSPAAASRPRDENRHFSGRSPDRPYGSGRSTASRLRRKNRFRPARL